MGASGADRTFQRFGTIALIIGCVIIAVSTVAVLVAGYPPIGDWGVMLVRSRDVGTSHTPLLGTRSSVTGGAAATIMHHPGPIEFYFTAPFVRAFGQRGLALAGAFNHAIWYGVLVALTGRVMGTRARFVVAIAGLGLIASMGVDESVSVWPPTAILFPLAVTMVAAGTLLLGDRRGWLPLVAGFTFVAQSNLAAAPMASVLLFTGLGAALTHRLRHGRPATLEGRRAAPIALGVGLVAWLPPIIEQVTDRNPNMTAILRGGSGDGPTFGLRRAAESVVAMVSSPFGWAGERFRSPWLPDASLGFGRAVTDPPWAVVGLGALLSLLAAFAALRRAKRTERDLRAFRLQGWLVGWIFAAALITAKVPFRSQVMSLGWIRWLWPVALTASAVTLWNLILVAESPLSRTRTEPTPLDDTSRRSSFAAALAPVILLVLACLPLAASAEPSRAVLRQMSVTSDSMTQLEAGVDGAIDRSHPAELILNIDVAGSAVAGAFVDRLEGQGVTVRPNILGTAEEARIFAVFGDERRQPPLTAEDEAKLPSLSLLWLNGSAVLRGAEINQIVGCGPIGLDACRELVALNRIPKRSAAEQVRRQTLLNAALAQSGLQLLAVYQEAKPES